ncbi:pirin family protein [Amorphus orientalis]|uniref:Redox-sensitive bicupin YhaK (Pirin superfamily) n=1 Tax=Amorphus orientalis TaxID=649198 RepID=A0AAE3VKW6_9HYPH|nr:pirin family protein [Amorphus orientalis]MDQ0314364.1 redox-sensitive bicupin YhaK (pirin superfamily) [Amorphus orientalis]
MSWQPADNPECTEDGGSPIETVIVPRARDIGSFEVRRALPSAKRQMVGPFIFFDQMGPADMPVGEGLDVRPHPHIGLATVTYLFDGEIMHRDSLGTVQAIRPGEVNWMTAGKGIAHSERSPGEERLKGPHMLGLQLWVALPKDAEETDPAFFHHTGDDLPTLDADGKRVRVMIGSLYGLSASVKTYSDTIYADVALDAGAQLPLDTGAEERAIYVMSGDIEIGGERYEPGRLIVFHPRHAATILARTATRLVIVGGESMDGPRHIWWNFVSSSKERIEDAKADWKAGRFAPVPGEHELIPLPER